MDFHVNHLGKDLGVFSLEELQRRRQSGEFSGLEHVWREGMTQWQPLDVILQSGPPPPPVPLPRSKKTSKAVVWGIVIASIFGLSVVIFLGFQGAKFLTRIRHDSLQSPGWNEDDVTNKKISWTTNTATYREARKKAGDFRRRVWLEGYLANADRSRTCDAEIIQMMNAWLVAEYGEPTTNSPNIAEWSDRLAARPDCDDPLLLAITALHATEMHEKSQRLERALEGFPKSRHKAYPRFNSEIHLLNLVNDQNRVTELTSSAIQSLKDCFKDGSIRPEDQGEVAEIFVTGWAYNFFHRMSRNIFQIPRDAGASFEWLSLVLEGEYHIIEAWRSRGGGFSDSVTEQGWQGFNNHSGAARQCLTRAWELRPDLALAPCRMIYVAMGESDADEMRTWFDRTVAAQIDYPKAWADMRWGLRPRWHGSLETMLAFGKLALDTKRFDTDVPRKFFDVVSDLESELKMPFGQHIYGRSDIWPEISRMYHGYIAEPTQENNRYSWQSAFVAVAYLGGKFDTARKQLEAINWEPRASNLSGWGRDLSLMPLEVAALTSPGAKKISDAESYYRHSHPEEALNHYRKLAEEPDLDFRSSKFVKHRIAALELEKRLAAGDWIDLLPSGTNDPAWEISLGTVQRFPLGALEVHANKNGHMLYCRARVGSDFEVRGDFEVVKTSTQDFQAGLVMGLPNLNTMEWYSLRMKRNKVEGDIVSFARGWSKQQVVNSVPLNPGRNTFQFQLKNGEANVSVNDRQVLQRARLQGNLPFAAPEMMVGLGSFNDMNDTVLRYHQVQLRRR